MASVPLKLFGRHLRNTAKNFSASRDDLYSAAIAYYLLIAAVPILILVVSVLGTVLGSSKEAVASVMKIVMSTIPAATTDALKIIARLVEVKGVTKGIGLVGLVYSSSQIFSVLEDALTVSWGCPARSWARRLLMSVGLSIAVGFFPLLSVLMTFSADLFNQFGIFFFSFDFAKVKSLTNWLSIGAPIILSWFFFATVYVVLPNCKVKFGAAIKGALLTAVLFEIVKHIISFYFLRFAHLDKIYGSIAGVVALVVWAQFAARVTLFGAEFARELQQANEPKAT